MNAIKAQELVNAFSEENVTCLAKDQSGEIWGFEIEPQVEEDHWEPVGNSKFFQVKGLNIEFESEDWKQCLVKKQIPFEVKGCGKYKTSNGEEAFVYYKDEYEGKPSFHYSIQGHQYTRKCWANGKAINGTDTLNLVEKINEA